MLNDISQFIGFEQVRRTVGGDAQNHGVSREADGARLELLSFEWVHIFRQREVENVREMLGGAVATLCRTASVQR